MGAGAASLQTAQKKEPAAAPGPPFPVNSAINGVSVNGAGQIVLGNDTGSFLAALLNDRELPMGAFKFSWLNGTNRLFVVDPTNQLYTLGDYDASGNSMALNIDDGNRVITLGALAAGNGTLLLIDDNLPKARISTTAGDMLLVDQANGIYEMGDIAGLSNGNFLIINDNTGQSQIGDINSLNLGTIFEVDSNNDVITARAGAEFKHIDANGALFLDSDITNGLYRFGDISGTLNNNVLSVDDTNRVIDIGDIPGGNYYEMDTSTGEVLIIGGGANQVRFSPSTAAGLWQIGDLTGLGNGTFLNIDDNTQLSSFNRPVVIKAITTTALTLLGSEQNLLIQDGSGTQNCGFIGRDSGTAGLVLQAPIAGITFDPAAGNDLTQTRGFFRYLGTTGNTLRAGANTTAPGTTVTPVFTSFYGGNTVAMGNPVDWILVNIAGTDRKIPVY